MAKSMQSRGIPTELSLEQFRQFVLPHLTVGSRGPAPKLSLHVYRPRFLGHRIEAYAASATG